MLTLNIHTIEFVSELCGLFENHECLHRINKTRTRLFIVRDGRQGILWETQEELVFLEIFFFFFFFFVGGGSFAGSQSTLNKIPPFSFTFLRAGAPYVSLWCYNPVQIPFRGNKHRIEPPCPDLVIRSVGFPVVIHIFCPVDIPILAYCPSLSFLRSGPPLTDTEP